MSIEAPGLLQQARGGDAGAWGRLLESFGPYLTLLARVQIGRRLQGKVDPADVVQETFLDAHRQSANFRGGTEAELAAWLRRILAGQLALVLRRYLGSPGRDINLEQELEADLDQSSQSLDAGFIRTQSTPSANASRREQALLLTSVLGGLSNDYREVLILRHLEGLTFPQVAQRMGRSENSVYKLWMRALANVRQSMENVQ